MEPQVTPNPSQNSVPPSPVVKQSLPPYFLIILFVITFAGGILTSLVTTGYFAKKEDINGLKTPVKQSEVVSANPDEIEGNEDIYAALILDNTTGTMKEDITKGLYGVRSSGKVEKLLPLTGNTYIKHAWFAGGFAYAYEECDAIDGAVCTIKKQSFGDTKTEDLLSLKRISQYLEVGVLSGSFSTDGRYFGYISHQANAQNDLSQPQDIVFSVYDTITKTDIELYRTTWLQGGRGGSLDDDVAIVFSPDGKKVAVTFTSWYPWISGDKGELKDVGTFFLFDRATRQLVYSKPGIWATFGRFINDRFVLVREMRKQSEMKFVPTVVRIDTTSGVAEDIGYVAGYQMMPIDDKSVLMMITGATPQSGVSFGSYQIDAKKFDLITPNVVPRMLGRLFGILSSTVPCFAGPSEGETIDCGMDMYNGVSTTGGKFSLYDITTKKSQVISLPEFNNYSVQAVR